MADIGGRRKKTYQMLPRRELDKSVYDLAVERMHHLFDLFDEVSVMFSGGKDSTVVLNVAYDVARERGALPLRVIFFDEEAIALETEAYVRRVSQLPGVAFEWYCVPCVHRNACSMDSPHWYPWAPEDKDKWVRPLPPEAITEIPGYHPETVDGRLSIPDLSGLLFPPERGNQCQVMGIRADESMTRRRMVMRKWADNYIIQGAGTDKHAAPHLSKAYPIYDWRITDVWTAPHTYGWDTNAAYAMMEMAGIPHPTQRVAPPYGEQPMRGLWMWQQCFPDIWDRMVERVPGANTAARYARTELYQAGKQKDAIQKPPDMTWQEAIRAAIAKHPVELRDTVAKRIQSEINLHNIEAGNAPILDVPHPISGTSWPWLYKLAVIGDFKNREIRLLQAAKDPTGKVYKEALAKWEAEQSAKSR